MGAGVRRNDSALFMGAGLRRDAWAVFVGFRASPHDYRGAHCSFSQLRTSPSSCGPTTSRTRS